MRVILRRNLDNLGDIGSIVNVKDGYARNYLIPRSLAYFATEKAIHALEVEKKQYERRQVKEKGDAEQLAVVLSEQQISITMKVGEEGRLYGSVTNQMIAQELALKGFELDRRNIVIDDAIKTLGVFDVKIKLHSEVYATLKVWVIGEE